MECLFFLSLSSSILLACYLDETLHCNMYGWNNVYVQLAMYEWMELYMYARWNLCAGYVICLLLNSPVKYIYIYVIYLLWKLLDLKKQKKEAPLPSAADGKGSFAVCRGRQRSHAAATCAPWELTHLVSLPIAADVKGFAYSGRRQRLVPQWRPADVIRRTAKAAVSRLMD